MKSIPHQPSCTDSSEYGTVHVSDARNIILDAINPICGFEKLTIEHAIKRVLFEDVASTINVPGHDNSAVDGFAIRFKDLNKSSEPTELKIIGTALAGSPCDQSLTPGTAIKIMTGAVLPAGTDSVLMQEHVEVLSTCIRVYRTHKLGENIRNAGEDVKKGTCVLSKGHLCCAADIGLMASLGTHEVKVKRKPRVAILSTGDEVRRAGTILTKGEIFDSNRYSIYAALRSYKIDITDLGIVGDNEKKISKALSEAAEYADMIITSGGVSVGQADYTKKLLRSLGNILVEKVAIKPGRPLLFGQINGCQFFGLPGNPVAVMVTYYQFVLSALQKLMGINPPLTTWTLTAQSLEQIRKNPGRTEIQRGILKKQKDGSWTVRTTGRQGSGILTSVSSANAFIILPHDRNTVEIGDTVEVQPFVGLG